MDSFGSAWDRLAQSMPDEFQFEIDYRYMLRLSFPVALERQAMLRDFTARAKDAGYVITQWEDFARATFVYHLKRRAPKDAAAPKANVLRAGAIDV